MGEVYLARHVRTDALVVLKVPKIELIGNKTLADRFHREIKSLARLAHRHIVPINDADEHEGVPFAVMKYLPGGTLNEPAHRPVWPDTGAFAPMGVLQTIGPWLPQVAEAIDYVHENHFVHRDIKPSNILFDDQGLAYLGDFGVAKVIGDINESTRSLAGAGADSTIATGRLLGTPPYVAPERFWGQESRFSDQYALAITVFELIAGRKPFCSPHDHEVMRQIQQGAIDIRSALRSVPSAVADVLVRGMAIRPEDRFGSCKEFAAALADALPGGEMAIGPVDEAHLACPHCNVVLALEASHGGHVIECQECHSSFVAQKHLAWLEPAATRREILVKQQQRLGANLQLLQTNNDRTCATCHGAVLVPPGDGPIEGPCPHCGGSIEVAVGHSPFDGSPLPPPPFPTPPPGLPASAPPAMSSGVPDLPPTAGAPYEPNPGAGPVFVNHEKAQPRHYRRKKKRRDQQESLLIVISGVFIAIVVIVIFFSL